MKKISPCLVLACLWATGSAAAPVVEQTIMIAETPYTVKVKNGYRLTLLTDQIPQPRLLTFHESGELFAGSRSGRVYRLKPPYKQVEALGPSFAYPHSVAFRGSTLFVASTEAVYYGRYQSGGDIESLNLLAKLPEGRGHNSRTVKVGPDERVYVSLGISGNCSNEYLHDTYPFEKRRGGVFVLDESINPPQWRAYSSGLRNPVGFDWSPSDQTLYASNNGPDHLGFQQPPEQFTQLSQGSFHGMPWYQYDGERVHRDRCQSSPAPYPIDKVVKPTATFPARNAPMAVTFVPNHADFGELAGHALVALRGSWAVDESGNKASRREPKIVAITVEGSDKGKVETLVSGFQLPSGERWARPVGIAIGPDNGIYISSDSPSGLYRLVKEL